MPSAPEHVTPRQTSWLTPGLAGAVVRPRNARKRRRIPLLRRWLPTVLAVAAVVLTVGVLGARFVTGRATAAPPPQPIPEVQTAPAPAAPVAPEPVATRAIRFTSVQIEPNYTVATGDTLSAIAQRMNTTVDAIVSINNLSERSTLSVGQRLILP